MSLIHVVNFIVSLFMGIGIIVAIYYKGHLEGRKHERENYLDGIPEITGDDIYKIMNR